MKLRNLFVTALLAFGLCTAGSAADYNGYCGNATISGTYVVSCSGFVTPPASPSLPFTVLGTVTADENGAIAGSVTNSVAGQVFKQAVSGQAQTRSDCTGNVTYNKGQKDELNVTYVVVASGNEMRGMVIDAGANVSCTLVRIKK